MFRFSKFIIFSFLLVMTVMPNQRARAMDLDPRIVSLGTIAAYGTAGGALLGVASLAFGTSGRSIARGASLGLYAGLIFGTYVVVSHHLKKNQSYDPEYYPSSPYEDYSGGSSVEDLGAPERWDRGQRLGEMHSLKVQESGHMGQKLRTDRIPLLNFNFSF